MSHIKIRFSNDMFEIFDTFLTEIASKYGNINVNLINISSLNTEKSLVFSVTMTLYRADINSLGYYVYFTF